MHKHYAGFQNETDGVPFPTHMWEGVPLISTHSSLLTWRISATLTRQESTEAAKEEKGLYICFTHEKTSSVVSEKRGRQKDR